MKLFRDRISVFQNLKSPPQTITLGQWLKACKYGSKTEKEKQVLEYRRCLTELIDKGYSIVDAKAELKSSGKDQLKKSLPLATVGGVCVGGRKLKNVVSRTGWIALDIDYSENPHLSDPEHLRDEVAKIANVAFTGLSTGGRGVWALVKVSEPERQAEHFQALQEDFKGFGITLDSSKGENPNDARFYSYDPGAIIKDAFTVYEKLPPPKPKPKQRRYQGPRARTSQEALFKGAETFARNRGYTFTHGVDMHLSITHLCIYLNLKGIPREEAEAYIDRHILPLSEIRSNCISGPYSQYASDHGALRDSDQYHARQEELPAKAKFESQDPAPYGFNPWTGVIFDERGYPADWDEVGITPEADRKLVEAV